MQLTKHHGLGNDFLVALVPHGEVPVSARAADLARRWCHRTRGVGADGLIFGEALDGDRADPGEPAHAMHLYNADGSAAEISGNGIRCLAQAVHRRDRAGHERDAVTIVVGGERRRLVVRTTADPVTVLVEVPMGVVGPGPGVAADLPLGGLTVTRRATADVGNPHLILATDDPVEVSVAGPRLEAVYAPTGINVHFLTVTGPDTIRLLHWERGAGVTEACGSGATVAATRAHEWGLVGDTVTVEMPGGSATVRVGERATLIGPATHIADIEVPDA